MPMHTLWPIIQKDFRALRGMYVLWVAVLAFEAWAAWALASLPVISADRSNADPLVLSARLLHAVVFLLVVIFVSRTDPPHAPTAFWRKLPISPLRLCAAKFVSLASVLVLLPALVQATFWGLYGFKVGIVAAICAESAFLHLVALAFLSALAASAVRWVDLVWATLGIAAFATIVTIGLAVGKFGTGFDQAQLLTIANRSGRLLETSQVCLGLIVLTLGATLAVVAHYQTRRRFHCWMFFNGAIIASLLAGYMCSWSWLTPLTSSRRTDVAVAWNGPAMGGKHEFTIKHRRTRDGVKEETKTAVPYYAVIGKYEVRGLGSAEFIRFAHVRSTVSRGGESESFVNTVIAARASLHAQEVSKASSDLRGVIDKMNAAAIDRNSLLQNNVALLFSSRGADAWSGNTPDIESSARFDIHSYVADFEVSVVGSPRQRSREGIVVVSDGPLPHLTIVDPDLWHRQKTLHSARYDRDATYLLINRRLGQAVDLNLSASAGLFGATRTHFAPRGYWYRQEPWNDPDWLEDAVLVRIRSVRTGYTTAKYEGPVVPFPSANSPTPSAPPSHP
jgi:hypothetical protein